MFFLKNLRLFVLASFLGIIVSIDGAKLYALDNGQEQREKSDVNSNQSRNDVELFIDTDDPAVLKVEGASNREELTDFLNDNSFETVRNALLVLDERYPKYSKELAYFLWKGEGRYKDKSFNRFRNEPVYAVIIAHWALVYDPDLISARNFLIAQRFSHNSIVKTDLALAMGELGGSEFALVMQELARSNDMDELSIVIGSVIRKGRRGASSDDLIPVLNQIIANNAHESTTVRAANLKSLLLNY